MLSGQRILGLYDILAIGQGVMHALVTDARERPSNLKAGAPPLEIKLSIVLCVRALGMLRICIVTSLDSLQICPNRTISMKQQTRV